MVLGADRPGTGEYVSPTFTLDDLGGQTDFIPCNSTIAGCTGPVSLTLALASAPTERVAHVDVLLVPPAGVGSIAHCMTGGNVMYLDGNDGVYTGMLTVVDAGWSSIGGTQRAVIEVTPTNPVQGTSWGLTFETRQLMIAMAPSVYEDAEQAPSEPPGHAGISINGTGSTCDYATGRFQIEEFTLGTNNDVKTLTASFEQYCTPADLTRVLTGCVHYAQ